MPTSIQKQPQDLVKIYESTIWSRSPESVFEKTVKVLAEVLECDSVAIYLLDVTGGHLIASAALSSLRRQDLRFSITEGRTLQMMQTHQPVIMDFQHLNPSDSIDRIPENMNFRSGISVPILYGDIMLGAYMVFYTMYYNWTKQNIEDLLCIGRLLGAIAHQAQTARKTIDLEILIERKRLCGELHDNLSQMIYSLNLNSEAALLSFEENKIETMLRDLEKIHCIAQEANQMLREELLSLRTPSVETGTLIPGIREYIKRFGQQWGLETELQVKDGLEPLIVSTQVELQIMRILQESLMNTLRHATASRVSVVLQGDQNRLNMKIYDNGKGFDPDAVSSKRLGLQIMHERAESLGGKLNVRSGGEAGTMVCLEIPIHARTGHP